MDNPLQTEGAVRGTCRLFIETAKQFNPCCIFNTI
jgi:hypothetical protein